MVYSFHTLVFYSFVDFCSSRVKASASLYFANLLTFFDPLGTPKPPELVQMNSFKVSELIYTGISLCNLSSFSTNCGGLTYTKCLGKSISDT